MDDVGCAFDLLQISWWARRILLFSSSDMSSKRPQTLQKMQQNHKKSVQTLVDGAIGWVHGHSPNHSRWNKIWNFDHVHPRQSNKNAFLMNLKFQFLPMLLRGFGGIDDMSLRMAAG